MGRVKIPYYTVAYRAAATGARTRKMRTLGFQIVRCGADGPEAWAIAAEWNAALAGGAQGEAPAWSNLDQLSRR